MSLPSFEVRDLTTDDLPSLEWAGNPSHLRNVAAKLEEADLDYLAVRAPDGSPVAIGCLTYATDSGDIGQLAVREELQSMGLGTRLIAEAERRLIGRGIGVATLGVEAGNLRARELYERLGYVAFGESSDSWEYEDAAGEMRVHEAQVVLMRKELWACSGD